MARQEAEQGEALARHSLVACVQPKGSIDEGHDATNGLPQWWFVERDSERSVCVCGQEYKSK